MTKADVDKYFELYGKMKTRAFNIQQEVADNISELTYLTDYDFSEFDENKIRYEAYTCGGDIDCFSLPIELLYTDTDLWIKDYKRKKEETIKRVQLEKEQVKKKEEEQKEREEYEHYLYLKEKFDG